jgi:sugar/nucleoside kinase (ribokinase family)
MVMEVMPSDDEDVSDVIPAIVESWRSIGAATDAAMVSALAPGSVAVMLMVGKSTAGSAATESSR